MSTPAKYLQARKTLAAAATANEGNDSTQVPAKERIMSKNTDQPTQLQDIDVDQLISQHPPVQEFGVFQPVATGYSHDFHAVTTVLTAPSPHGYASAEILHYNDSYHAPRINVHTEHLTGEQAALDAVCLAEDLLAAASAVRGFYDLAQSEGGAA